MATQRASTIDRQRRRRRLLQRAGLVGLVLALGAAWVWQRTLPLQRIDVVGAVHADSAAVAALAGVEPGAAALFSISPALTADRAQRHPWVERAEVRRLPTGTLRIRVVEREPAALVLDDAGRPSYFLDAAGYRMPVEAASPTLYDVPILRGRVPPYHPTQPVDSRALRELLAALATADDETDALVSEIDWRSSGPVLWTSPAGTHGSIPVRLGRGGQAEGAGYADQLARLRAFWDQAVLPRTVPVRAVDLRFDGQVVTREGAPPRPAPDSTAAAASTTAPAVAP